MKNATSIIKLDIDQEHFWELYPGYSEKSNVFNHDHTSSVAYLSLFTLLITSFCLFFYLKEELFLDYLIISATVLIFFGILLIIRGKELRERLNVIQNYVNHWSNGQIKTLRLTPNNFIIEGEKKQIISLDWNDIYQIKIEDDFIQTDIIKGQNIIIPRGRTTKEQWENLGEYISNISEQ